MDLEDKLIMGILLVSSGLLAYGGAKLTYDINKVKQATTKFLDSFTSYLSQRISNQEDVKRLAEFVKYRRKSGI